MSYDIELCDPETGDVIIFPFYHILKGGTYKFGGDNSASLNITYNYSPFFIKAFGEKGIRSIYGTTATESIPLLEKGIEILKNDDVTENYWDSTEGNAKKALKDLLYLAKNNIELNKSNCKYANGIPIGIWGGD